MKDQPRVNRRSALKAIGASALAPALTHSVAPWLGLDGYHPLVPRQPDGTPWRPVILTPAQNELVTVLAELIIPQTDTPGAAAAGVNQYIDWRLSLAEAATRAAFLAGLDWLDQRARQMDGAGFVALEPSRQASLLAPLETVGSVSAGAVRDTRASVAVEFLTEMKRLTIAGYYGSEAGMRQELRFAGSRYVPDFEGCTHPEHTAWAPQAGRDAGSVAGARGRRERD